MTYFVTFTPEAFGNPEPVEVEFNEAINLSITVEAEDEIGNDIPVDNITLTSSVLYDGITLTDGIPATAIGTFEIDIFGSIVSHVSKGSSDLLETPVIELISDVPDNREVFNISISVIPKITFTLTATAHLSNGELATAQYIYELYNDYSEYAGWITDYLENRY
jgi:hypothetical protein